MDEIKYGVYFTFLKYNGKKFTFKKLFAGQNILETRAMAVDAFATCHSLYWDYIYSLTPQKYLKSIDKIDFRLEFSFDLVFNEEEFELISTSAQIFKDILLMLDVEADYLLSKNPEVNFRTTIFNGSEYKFIDDILSNQLIKKYLQNKFGLIQYDWWSTLTN